MSSAYPQPAECEDYDSDLSEAKPETRKVANVSLKRKSNSSGLGKPLESPPARSPPDGASDSGYSSHTAATKGSPLAPTASVNGSTNGVRIPPPPAAPTALRVNTDVVDRRSSPAKRRPTLVDQRAPINQSSPRKAPARPVSKPRRPREEQPVSETESETDSDTASECDKLGCDCDLPPTKSKVRAMKAQAAAAKEAKESRETRTRRPPPTPLAKADIHYASYTQPPPSYHTPPSPSMSRHPSGYPPQIPITSVPARTRSSSKSRPRPISYHSGMPDPGFWSGQHAYPTPEMHGPPPSASAYTSQAYGQQYPPQSYMPPTPFGPPLMTATPPTPGFFVPPSVPPPQTSPTFDNPRPSLSTRQSEASYSARSATETTYSTRPGSMYGAPPPPVYNDQQSQPGNTTYSARYQSTSVFEDDDVDDREAMARKAMPPPPAPPSRRLSMRQSNSSSSVPRPSSMRPDRDRETRQITSREEPDHDQRKRNSRAEREYSRERERERERERKPKQITARPEREVEQQPRQGRSSRPERDYAPPRQITQRGQPVYENDDDEDDDDDDEFDQDATIRPSRQARRTSSARRPSLASGSSGRTKATSYSNSSGSAKIVTVESARGRRLSYMGHEPRHELEEKAHRIEAYQDASRGGRATPLTAEALKKVKQRESDSGSHASRSSKDGSSRVSRVTSRTPSGEVEVVTPPTPSVDAPMDGLTIRVGGMNLHLSDELKGVPISLRANSDGQAELVIQKENPPKQAPPPRQVEETRKTSSSSNASQAGRTSKGSRSSVVSSREKERERDRESVRESTRGDRDREREKMSSRRSELRSRRGD